MKGIELNKNRENTVFYDFEKIKKESQNRDNVYFSNKIKYKDLKNYDTDCVPVAQYLDENGQLEVIFSREPTHCIGIGCTGAGKTTSLVIPKVQILSSLKNKPSFFIVDVKGDLHDKLSGQLKEKGYNIKVIDLFEPEYSESWNPLSEIYDKYMEANNIVSRVKEHHDSIDDYPNIVKFTIKKKPSVWYELDNVAYSDIKTLNKAIVHRCEKLLSEVSEEVIDLSYTFIITESKDDPHWDNTARDLFAGVIFGMLERSLYDDRHALTKNQFNLRNIVNLILSTPDSELREFINSCDHSKDAYKFANRIVNMEAEKTKSCYFGVLSTQLSPFKSYAIQKLTIRNSIDLTTLADKPEAIFIKMDDLKESNFKVAQLMILRLYKKLKDKAMASKNQRLDRPVHFILDEFGNFPKFNNFNNMISVSRSYNIWYTIIIQSYSQLNMKYGNNVAEIIIENSNMLLFFGTNDYNTMKDFSDSCGKISILSEYTYLRGDLSSITNGTIEELSTVPISNLTKIEPNEVYIVCFQMPVMHSRMLRSYMIKEFEPLPKVEYRIMDEVEIGSKKYTYDLSRNRGGKPKEIRLKYSNEENDNPSRNNFIDKLSFIVKEIGMKNVLYKKGELPAALSDTFPAYFKQAFESFTDYDSSKVYLYERNVEAKNNELREYILNDIESAYVYKAKQIGIRKAERIIKEDFNELNRFFINVFSRAFWNDIKNVGEDLLENLDEYIDDDSE